MKSKLEIGGKRGGNLREEMVKNKKGREIDLLAESRRRKFGLKAKDLHSEKGREKE